MRCEGRRKWLRKSAYGQWTFVNTSLHFIWLARSTTFSRRATHALNTTGTRSVPAQRAARVRFHFMLCFVGGDRRLALGPELVRASRRWHRSRFERGTADVAPFQT